MMTINNEKYYTEYEVSVVQEMTTIIAPKLIEMEWEQKTAWEIHQYIRTKLFDEFYDYLCNLGLLNSTAISISEADYMEQNTSDLDVIDAFCDKKLKELGYKELPKFKQANYDTLVEFGLQSEDLICSGKFGHDEINTIALEWEKQWQALSDEERDKIGWLESVTEFLDKKRKSLGMPTEQELRKSKAKKKEMFDYDVAYILVQLTEDFSKELYEKIDPIYCDTDIRGEFLRKMAIDIAKSKEWKDCEITAGEVIENAIAAKRKEFEFAKAKYKVGDIVYVFDDLEIVPAQITDVIQDGEDNFLYSFKTYFGREYEQMSEGSLFSGLDSLKEYVANISILDVTKF